MLKTPRLCLSLNLKRALFFIFLLLLLPLVSILELIGNVSYWLKERLF